MSGHSKIPGSKSSTLASDIQGQSLPKLMESIDKLDPASRLDASIERYRAWLEYNEKSPLAYAAYFNLGCALSQSQALEPALQAYRSALAKNPAFPQAHLNSGLVLEAMGRPDEAILAWQAILAAASPVEPALRILALNHLARVLELRGRHAESLDCLGQSLALDPQQADVRSHWTRLQQDTAAAQAPQTPRLSVIIATHERPKLLARAVASVKSQSQGRLQLIVIADSWDPATYAAIAPLLDGEDIFMQRSGSPGPAASRNLGLDLAQTEYIVFLDDDDSFSPGFVDALLPHLQGEADSVLYCNACFLYEDRRTETIVTLSQEEYNLGGLSVADIEIRNNIPNNCQIFPRKLIGNRRFDASLILFEDWEFLLNVLAEAELRHIPVTGPYTHKNDRSLGERRGARNDHLLLDTILEIYAKWPGRFPQTKAARKAYLLAAGASPDRL